MFAMVYHKSVSNKRRTKLALTEDEFYNLAWDYAIENTPGSGESEDNYQQAQELVDRIYTEASKDRFNCGDYSLFIRKNTDDLSDIARPNC